MVCLYRVYVVHKINEVIYIQCVVVLLEVAVYTYLDDADTVGAGVTDGRSAEADQGTAAKLS